VRPPPAAETDATSGLPKLALGPLQDEDARHVFWSALDKRLSRTQKAGDGDVTIELGDYESFFFTVVKVQHAGDDVSSDTPQPADAVSVEVTGWYKKSGKQGGQTKDNCFSFDVTLPAALQGGKWQVPEAAKAELAREDAEDCY
jgi:hypothetical protein